MSKQVFLQYRDAAEQFEGIVAAHEVLDATTQTRLLAHAAAGSQSAIEKLILHNLRIILLIVKEFHRAYTDDAELKAELFAAGVEGLRHAIENYKAGYPLFPYAKVWIKYHMQQTLAQTQYQMRVSDSFFKDSMKVFKAISEYNKKYECEPDVKEIAQITGLKEQKINEILAFGEDRIDYSSSEDYPVVSDDAPDKSFYLKDIEDVVYSLLDSRSAEIVLADEKTTTLSKKYNLTCARINQIRRAAISKLQANREAFVGLAA